MGRMEVSSIIMFSAQDPFINPIADQKTTHPAHRPGRDTDVLSASCPIGGTPANLPRRSRKPLRLLPIPLEATSAVADHIHAAMPAGVPLSPSMCLFLFACGM